LDDYDTIVFDELFQGPVSEIIAATTKPPAFHVVGVPAYDGYF
jgi:hypothetical protein